MSISKHPKYALVVFGSEEDSVVYSHSDVTIYAVRDVVADLTTVIGTEIRFYDGSDWVVLE